MVVNSTLITLGEECEGIAFGCLSVCLSCVTQTLPPIDLIFHPRSVIPVARSSSEMIQIVSTIPQSCGKSRKFGTFPHSRFFFHNIPHFQAFLGEKKIAESLIIFAAKKTFCA